MRVAIALFTRDLRVHDNPVLHAACHAAAEVVPLFVLDSAILRSGVHPVLPSLAASAAPWLAGRSSPDHGAGAATADYRTRHDRWRHDEQAAQAWRDGRTGYPIVDAGMRQLRAEGWMHNRGRLITASFLTKTLYLDWRIGARHFFDLLVDADVANNQLNWQWVAGTGTDTRPNRILNPLRQAQRYAPPVTSSAGTYLSCRMSTAQRCTNPGSWIHTAGCCWTTPSPSSIFATAPSVSTPPEPIETHLLGDCSLADSEEVQCGVEGIAARGSAEPGWRVELRNAVGHVDPPVRMVDEPVMAAAERRAVADAGRAPVGPRNHVMDFAPSGRNGTARKTTSTIAQHHRATDRRGHRAAGASDIEWFTSGAQYDRDELGVTGDATGNLGVDRTAQG